MKHLTVGRLAVGCLVLCSAILAAVPVGVGTKSAREKDARWTQEEVLAAVKDREVCAALERAWAAAEKVRGSHPDGQLAVHVKKTTQEGEIAPGIRIRGRSVLFEETLPDGGKGTYLYVMDLSHATYSDKDGNGFSVGFHTNGSISSFIEHAVDQPKGAWLHFHQNGAPQSYMQVENWHRVGRTFKWNSDGTLTEMRKLEKPEPIHVKGPPPRNAP